MAFGYQARIRLGDLDLSLEQMTLVMDGLVKVLTIDLGLGKRTLKFTGELPRGSRLTADVQQGEVRQLTHTDSTTGLKTVIMDKATGTKNFNLPQPMRSIKDENSKPKKSWRQRMLLSSAQNHTEEQKSKLLDDGITTFSGNIVFSTPSIRLNTFNARDMPWSELIALYQKRIAETLGMTLEDDRFISTTFADLTIVDNSTNTTNSSSGGGGGASATAIGVGVGVGVPVGLGLIIGTAAAVATTPKKSKGSKRPNKDTTATTSAAPRPRPLTFFSPINSARSGQSASQSTRSTSSKSGSSKRADTKYHPHKKSELYVRYGQHKHFRTLSGDKISPGS